MKAMLSICSDEFLYNYKSSSKFIEPESAIFSINSIFKIYDNENVKFSNVITKGVLKDAHIYPLANRNVTLMNCKDRGDRWCRVE